MIQAHWGDNPKNLKHPVDLMRELVASLAPLGLLGYAQVDAFSCAREAGMHIEPAVDEDLAAAMCEVFYSAKAVEKGVKEWFQREKEEAGDAGELPPELTTVRGGAA